MKHAKTLVQLALACKDLDAVAKFLASQAGRITGAEQILVILFERAQGRETCASQPAEPGLRLETSPAGLIRWTAKTGQALAWTQGRLVQTLAAGGRFISAGARRSAIFKKRWLRDAGHSRFPVHPRQTAVWPLATSPAAGVVLLFNFRKKADWQRRQPELAALLQIGAMACAALEQRQQLEDRIHRSLAVSEIAQTIGATLDIDVLLKLIILEVSKTMQCQAGDIWFKSERQKAMAFQISLGLKNSARGRLLSPACTQQVLNSGEALLLNDVRTSPGADLEALGREGIVSLAAVPLKTKNQIIGVMHLYARQPKQFTIEEATLLKTLAGQAAMAIDNAQLFKDTKRRAQEQLGLYEVAQVISEISNLSAALAQIVDRISNILNVEKCWMMFPDEPRRELRAHPAAVGASEEQLAALRSEGDGGSISMQVFRNARPYYTNEAQAEPEVRAEFQNIFQLRNFMAVPLRSRNQTLGVLYAANKRENAAFTANDVRLFKTLASAATVVIQNAHLYDKLHRSYMSLVQVISEMIDTHDRYTRGHSERVSRYAAATARHLNLPPEAVEAVTIAGRLHDLGKIGISDKILVKDSELNPDEVRKVQNHPVLGEYILKTADFPLEIQAMIRHHHERHDGTGYPDRLAGTAIPLGARILAVADAFDGLTTSHKHQAAMTVLQGLEEIRRQAGKQFDPEVVKAFMESYEQRLSDAGQGDQPR